MNKILRLIGRFAFLSIGFLVYTRLVTACTRIFWNTNPGLLIVGRNEDYVTASHPTLVATARGVTRWGTTDTAKMAKAISWTVKYGNVAVYANNRFPNDGMNEAGLTARTLYYIDGDPNEPVAPDDKKKELDEDHWVSFVLDNFATVAEAVDAIRNQDNSGGDVYDVI